MSRIGSQPAMAPQTRPGANGPQGSEGVTVAAADSSQGRTIRHAHLYLTRLDPWSVMKSAFMLSIAIAIVLIVATLVLWLMLTASGTLTSLTSTIDDIAGSGASAIDITSMLSFGRVMGFTVIVSLMEVVLVSAMATLFAYLYNVAVGITGGLQVTLTEDS